MTVFMDDDILLESKLAKELYYDFAQQIPIIDYHCHISADDIARNRKYENPTQIMLGGDHYKWRLMRFVGIDEMCITGSASDYEKFVAFAEAIQLSVGHPVYMWTHMELKTYFNYTGTLSPDTVEDVWNICCNKLKNGLTVREIMKRSAVNVICTTDDPVDDLEAHRICKKDRTLEVSVLPTFRPDKAVNIGKKEFNTYITHLSNVVGKKIDSLPMLKEVLEERLLFFIKNGCKISDHGLDKICFNWCSDECANKIFDRVMKGEPLDYEQETQYITNMMIFFGRIYAKHNIVMQLHYGALRNINGKMMQKLGPDTGFDCINDTGCGVELAKYLDCLESSGELPRTIVYSLNPTDNALLDTIVGSFFEEGVRGKVQHGAAWWFNDNLNGIEEQLTRYASLNPIGAFLGMLTDSRCFLSFSRHDFFRRIFCNWMAKQILSGGYPFERKTIESIIKKVSYENCNEYFQFGRDL